MQHHSTTELSPQGLALPASPHAPPKKTTQSVVPGQGHAPRDQGEARDQLKVDPHSGAASRDLRSLTLPPGGAPRAPDGKLRRRLPGEDAQDLLLVGAKLAPDSTVAFGSCFFLRP